MVIAALLAAALSVWARLQFGFSGGHIDEYDYLFVGKSLWADKPWRSYIYIFGSNLSWYLLGFGDRWLGGLEGARLVAGVFGLLSLWGMYLFTKALWQSRAIALLATLLLAIQAVHVFISRFATYDVIALAFFSLSLMPLLVACQRTDRTRYAYLLAAVVLFGLAVTSKYVVIVYLPLLTLVAWLLAAHIGLLFGLGSISIVAVYIYVHWVDLLTLFEVQIRGVHGANATREFILSLEARYLWLPLVLWLAALMWRVMQYKGVDWRDRAWQVWLMLLLLALPLAVYHLHGQNMISLFKHLVYALFFLMPVVAWLLWRVVQHYEYRWWIQSAVVVLIAGMVWLNQGYLRDMEQAYPNVAEIVPTLSAALKTDDDGARTTILSEDPYLFRYLAFDTLPQRQIRSPNWIDNNFDGTYETRDVIDALWDRKFTYVFLNDQLHPKKNEKLRKVMKMRGYQQVFSAPYHTSNIMSHHTRGALTLYRSSESARIPFEEDRLFSEGHRLSD